MAKSFLRLVSLLALITALLVLPGMSLARPLATASSYGGTYANWPTDAQWKVISGLNDGDDGLSNERVDLVGDDTNPGGYFYSNADYLFYRLRVDDGAATEFSDTIMILIDTDGDANHYPNYAFSWDSQSSDQTKHGLELQVQPSPLPSGNSWADIRMDDADGLNADKQSPPDFGLSNGDGYVRIINNQSTTNFGTTTFVDFAIKWSFLEANTTLRKNQTWGIQFGTIDQRNDHNWVGTDVGGNRNPSDSRTTFPGTTGTGPNTITLSQLTARSSTGLPAMAAAMRLLAVLAVGVTVLRWR